MDKSLSIIRKFETELTNYLLFSTATFVLLSLLGTFSFDFALFFLTKLFGYLVVINIIVLVTVAIVEDKIKSEQKLQDEVDRRVNETLQARSSQQTDEAVDGQIEPVNVDGEVEVEDAKIEETPTTNVDDKIKTDDAKQDETKTDKIKLTATEVKNKTKEVAADLAGKLNRVIENKKSKEDQQTTDFPKRTDKTDENK